jgi:hypothetical protein
VLTVSLILYFLNACDPLRRQAGQKPVSGSEIAVLEA